MGNSGIAVEAKTMNVFKWIKWCLAGIGIVMMTSYVGAAESEMLWKKTFDSPIVKTAQMINVPMKKGTKFPLQTVMTEKNIFVFDHKGHIQKEIPIQSFEQSALSDNGTTMATFDNGAIAVSHLISDQKNVIHVLDSQPEIISEHVSFSLSPDGQYIVIVSIYSHTLYFHSSTGKLIKQHKVKNLSGAEIKFSKNGQFSAIHIPNWGKGNLNGYVLVFNHLGNKIQQFEHSGCQAEFDISDDGQFIAMAVGNQLYLYDTAGSLHYQKQLKHSNHCIRLSHNGQYLILANQVIHQVSLINNHNGDILWNVQLDNLNGLNSPFSSIDISDDCKTIGIAVNKNWSMRNDYAKLYLIDGAGILKWSKEMASSILTCSVTKDGAFVLFGNRKELLLYKTNNHPI